MSYNERRPEPPIAASALAIATAESRDCPFCGGSGLATVFAPGYRGDAIGTLADGRKYVARTVAHCRCSLGRFIRTAAPEDVRQRTPEVEEICQGRSHWTLDDPTDEPIDDPTAPADAAAFAALWLRVRSSRVGTIDSSS